MNRLPYGQSGSDRQVNLQPGQFAATLVPALTSVDGEVASCAAVAGALQSRALFDEVLVDALDRISGDSIRHLVIDNLYRREIPAVFGRCRIASQRREQKGDEVSVK